MVYEKLNLNVNHEALKDEFLQRSKDLAPVMLTQFFGGWSITSSDGSYKDGWIRGDDFSAENTTPNYPALKIETEKGFLPLKEYRKPTELCGPEGKGLLDLLSVSGLTPLRARYMLLKAGGESNYHRDRPESVYAVRLHIPIITHQNCLFVCEAGSVHLEPRAAYLLKVNRLHKVVNPGPTDRIHFVCDVFDTKKISQFHQLTESDISYFRSRESSR